MKTVPIVIILGLQCVVFSCNKPEETHYSSSKMEAILLDITLAEFASARPESSRNFAGVKNMDTLAVYYKSIFAHHNTTPEQFAASMDWYKKNQKELDTVLAHVLTRTEKMLNETPIAPMPPPVAPPSIKNLPKVQIPKKVNAAHEL